MRPVYIGANPVWLGEGLSSPERINVWNVMYRQYSDIGATPLPSLEDEEKDYDYKWSMNVEGFLVSIHYYFNLLNISIKYILSEENGEERSMYRRQVSQWKVPRIENVVN